MSYSSLLRYYKDPTLSKAITQKIAELAKKIDEGIMIMHVCGSHEWTITHYGIRSLLPDNVEVRAGPGCPVCITPATDIDDAVKLALDGIVVTTYGDMSRAKGTKMSLEEAKANGGDIRVIYGIQDAVKMARMEPNKQFTFFAVGMDTTAPATAFELLKGIPNNLSFLISYRYTPAIQGSVMESNVLGIDAFISAGHSVTVTGLKPYYPYFLKSKKPMVATGFEPLDVLMSIYMILKQIEEGYPKIENEYTRSVTWEGNIKAQEVMEKVYDLDEGYVRGVAVFPRAGFRLKEDFKKYDARVQYGLKDRTKTSDEHVAGARCGEVVMGTIDPPECPLYMKKCSPQDPKGAPMVSQEGTCWIWAMHKIANPSPKCRR
ncbi:hydrogenase expression protein HypD [Candidatus Acidianus copahuensis]|uniref:Hydrogenase expression protein HypD n=1 Tax=Candidatus Acidianus copahuensis TaxID=1160895 RepID=A0A031LM64_9CREN|nr:hydrogenase formation protein HypD [Candidatus Acidianus copahuensis]EZQ01978.1 hydrogenase expression protein HypD [Candidatus Acidianus copahuensis]